MLREERSQREWAVLVGTEDFSVLSTCHAQLLPGLLPASDDGFHYRLLANRAFFFMEGVMVFYRGNKMPAKENRIFASNYNSLIT